MNNVSDKTTCNPDGKRVVICELGEGCHGFPSPPRWVRRSLYTVSVRPNCNNKALGAGFVIVPAPMRGRK